MSKIENKKQQKKDTLFSAAFDLFTTKGFAKTSISDIVSHAGIAKGTFYLYFKDKYDIRNKLVSYKASEICQKAYTDLQQQSIEQYEDRIIYFADHVINQFIDNKMLLRFISKNLSWAILKGVASNNHNNKRLFDFEGMYHILQSYPGYSFQNPDILIFLIMELVSGSCYHAILESSLVTIEELKPHLYSAIRAIIHSQLLPVQEKNTQQDS